MIILYTTEICPQCKMLKKKMEAKHIQFTECKDIKTMEAMGISSVPLLDVDGKLMLINEANEWINNQEG